MSQAKILELLKGYPKGLLAKEIREMLGLSNCYGQLAKLVRSKEITKDVIGNAYRWRLVSNED